MICVVTVTYGDRSHFLEQVVTRVLNIPGADHIDSVVIVDNASSPKSQTYLDTLQRCEPRVKVVHLERNEGSAGGFKKGLEVALQTGSPYVWLLDDDNVPEPKALQTLLDKISEEGHQGALLSLRAGRLEYMRYARGADKASCFTLPNGFIGYSLRSKAHKLFKKSQSSRCGPLIVPYAPYGGLLVRSRDLRQVELPDPDYFTYADDTDFTYRLTQAGIPIELVPDSRITDVDRSWNIANDDNPIYFLSPYVLLTEERTIHDRLYYTVRNLAALSSKHRTSTFEYSLNMVFYLFLIACTSLAAATVKRKRAPLRSFLGVLRGVYDGSRGKLGRID